MSIPVEATELADAAEPFTVCYLLTTGDDHRPHATHVRATIDGASITCGLGRRTARNALARPEVSLLWPPHEPGGYSLIADGTIAVHGTPGDDATGVVTVANAVLHRPATPDSPPAEGCAADCAPVTVPGAPT